MTGYRSEVATRQGTAEDIAFLVRVYSALSDAGRSQLLADAAGAAARDRIGTQASDGEVPASEALLDKLASDSIPRDHRVSSLLSLARDANPLVMEEFWPNGLLVPVMTGSADELPLAEDLYTNYLFFRENADCWWGPLPYPAEHLGIEVDKAEFRDFTADGWEVDQEAMDAEIEERCIAEFACFFREWRANFFGAVLAMSRSLLNR